MKLFLIPISSSKSSICNNNIYNHIKNVGVYRLENNLLPRHHWKFCENNSAFTHASDSGSYPNRIIRSGATLASIGKIDYAAYIPSSTTANHLKSDYAYNETYKSMTISTWIKINTLNSIGNYIYYRNNTYLFIKQITNRGSYTTTFTFRYNNDFIFEYSVITPTSNNIYGVNINDWFLFTNVINIKDNDISYYSYFNSINVYSDNRLLLFETQADYTSTHYHYIGNTTTPNSATTLNGYLCDFRIYDRALSQQEVASLYNYGRGTYQQSIVLGYPTSLQPITHLKLQERSSVSDISDSGTIPNLWYGTGVMVLSGVSNTTTSYTYCYYNSANNQLSGSSSICSFSSHTYSLWYKKIGLTANTYILRTADNASINLETLSGTNDLRVRVYNGSVDISAGINNWVHIVVALNNTTKTFKVYLSGEYVTGGTWTSGTCVSTFRLLNSNCVGYVQDFRIYPYILNDIEIKNLFNSGNSLLI